MRWLAPIAPPLLAFLALLGVGTVAPSLAQVLELALPFFGLILLGYICGKLVDIPEEPIRTKHGERWLHTKKIPILDGEGRPSYLLGISHDITEARAAAEQLRQQAQELDVEAEPVGLQRFEQRLESVISGVFARAFRSAVKSSRSTKQTALLARSSIWKRMLGIRSRSRESRSQGSSLRNRIAVSNVAPPHISSENICGNSRA